MNIVKSMEEVFFANGRYWGGLNSSLYKRGRIRAMNTGIESADLNMVWNEEPLVPEDAVEVREVKKHYRKIGLPFWWWVFPGAGPSVTGDMLKAEGLSFVDSVPSMYADLSAPEEGAFNQDILVRQIKNREDLFLWEEVSFAGFDFPQDTRNQYHRFVSSFNLQPGSPQKYFLASVNGKPAATSLLFLHKNAGGIYFVTTLAAERKKGIGLAITYATMRHAREAGASFATLQSSPDGLRVYEQAGFKEYCRVDVYSPAKR